MQIQPQKNLNKQNILELRKQDINRPNSSLIVYVGDNQDTYAEIEKLATYVGCKVQFGDREISVGNYAVIFTEAGEGYINMDISPFVSALGINFSQKRLHVRLDKQYLIEVLIAAGFPRKAKLFLVSSVSGGVGASTICAALGIALPAEVALVQLATAGSSVHLLIGTEEAPGLFWHNIPTGPLLPQRFYAGLPKIQHLGVLSHKMQADLPAETEVITAIRALSQSVDFLIVDMSAAMFRTDTKLYQLLEQQLFRFIDQWIIVGKPGLSGAVAGLSLLAKKPNSIVSPQMMITLEANYAEKQQLIEILELSQVFTVGRDKRLEVDIEHGITIVQTAKRIHRGMRIVAQYLLANCK